MILDLGLVSLVRSVVVSGWLVRKSQRPGSVFYGAVIRAHSFIANVVLAKSNAVEAGQCVMVIYNTLEQQSPY